VIDRRRLDPSGPRGGRQKQQRKTVRAAGDGNSELCVSGDEPIEVA